MIYFIHGPDRQLARQAATDIATEHDPEAANTSWLDGRETTVERVVTAIGSAGFFGKPRVIVVTELLGRSPRDGAGSDAESPGAERSASAKHLDALLVAAPWDNVLILVEPAMASPPAVFKAAAASVKIVAADPPRGAALLRWIEEAAQHSSASIDRRAAQYLAQKLYPQSWERKPSNPRFDRPPDMAALSQEIDKLALAAYPGPITLETVQASTAGGSDDRLFKFVDAAMRGDVRSSLVELDKLLNAGEEPAMILAQILGQIEIAAVATTAGSRDAGAVARDLGSISPGRLSAVMSTAQRRRPGLAATVVAAGAATDRRLKTGRIRQPVDALHDLVLALATAHSDPQFGRSM